MQAYLCFNSYNEVYDFEKLTAGQQKDDNDQNTINEVRKKFKINDKECSSFLKAKIKGI